MHGWPFFRRRVSHDLLLNEGLALAMDWGSDWLAPIDSRMRRRHPRLRDDELEALDAACREAMRFAHESVYGHLQHHGIGIDADAFATTMRERYHWISDENLARLLRQGTYYAAKTGRYAR